MQRRRAAAPIRFPTPTRFSAPGEEPRLPTSLSFPSFPRSRGLSFLDVRRRWRPCIKDRPRTEVKLFWARIGAGGCGRMAGGGLHHKTMLQEWSFVKPCRHRGGFCMAVPSGGSQPENTQYYPPCAGGHPLCGGHLLPLRPFHHPRLSDQQLTPRVHMWHLPQAPVRMACRIWATTLWFGSDVQKSARSEELSEYSEPR